jgi:hypothetical protein
MIWMKLENYFNNDFWYIWHFELLHGLKENRYFHLCYVTQSYKIESKFLQCNILWQIISMPMRSMIEFKLSGNKIMMQNIGLFLLQ